MLASRAAYCIPWLEASPTPYQSLKTLGSCKRPLQGYAETPLRERRGANVLDMAIRWLTQQRPGV